MVFLPDLDGPAEEPSEWVDLGVMPLLHCSACAAEEQEGTPFPALPDAEGLRVGIHLAGAAEALRCGAVLHAQELALCALRHLHEAPEVIEEAALLERAGLLFEAILDEMQRRGLMAAPV